MFLNISGLLKGADKLKALFLDLIFPVECLSCSHEGVWLCQDCFRKLEFQSSQYCLHCKEENNYGQFCDKCRALYYLNGVWIAGDYEDKIIAQLIKSLKYRFARDINLILANFLSSFLQNLIKQSRLTSIDLHHDQIWRRLEKLPNIPQPLLDLNYTLVIPVPLHKKRRRWRGFNQAQGIATEVGKNFSLKVNQENLIRIKHKKPQAKLGEVQRKENIKNCFAWQGNNLAGQPIILIDDVTTTGSTLNECAKVLKQHGAGEVWGLVVAKG